jgi:hypothetical protein
MRAFFKSAESTGASREYPGARLSAWLWYCALPSGLAYGRGDPCVLAAGGRARDAAYLSHVRN